MTRMILLLGCLLACGDTEDTDDDGGPHLTDTTGGASGGGTTTPSGTGSSTSGGTTGTSSTGGSTGGSTTGGSTSGSTTSGSTTSGSTTGGSTTGGTTPTSALPDVWDETDPEFCQDTDLVGATSHFIGELTTADGATYTGTETWALFANDAWVDVGGADCIVVWSINAAVGAPGACSTCEFGLEIDATLDAFQTDCPEGLYVGDERWSTSYDVDIDGLTATITYGSSGSDLASGYADATGLVYITPAACMWF